MHGDSVGLSLQTLHKTHRRKACLFRSTLEDGVLELGKPSALHAIVYAGGLFQSALSCTGEREVT